VNLWQNLADYYKILSFWFSVCKSKSINWKSKLV